MFNKYERHKDKTPSTNEFLLWIPLFLFLAWIGREALPPLPSVSVGSYPVREAGYNPVCGNDSICILGWRL